MRYFPAFLDLAGQETLVVGGGNAATGKIRLLLKARARVRVVAPKASAEITRLAAEGIITWTRRGFVAGDLRPAVIAHATTGSDAVDRRVSEAAREAGVPVNVVDRPDLSSFVMPAIVDRDPVVICISSGGTSPLLARRLRETIEALLPNGLGRLARFAESFRGAVKAKVPDPRARRRFWEGFFDGPIADLVLRGALPSARERMLSLVNRPTAVRQRPGEVTVVEAGPGEPDLLTVRAVRLIQQADVIFHDQGINPAILDHARRDAKRVSVDDLGSKPCETTSAMAAQAEAGARVVRLVSGQANPMPIPALAEAV